MKNINYVIVCMLTIGTVFLYGCKGDNLNVYEGLNYDKLSDVDISVEHDGKIYGGKLCFSPERVGSIRINTPDDIKDVVFSWENDKIKVSKDKLSYETDKSLLTENSFIMYIINVLNALKEKENITESGKSEDKYVIKGACKSGKYEITLGTNNVLEKIKIPEKNFEVTLNID